MTVLSPDVAADEEELPQFPAYVMFPASFELNVKSGVLSLSGVGTSPPGMTQFSVGLTVSTLKVFTDKLSLVLLALSVTLILQSL